MTDVRYLTRVPVSALRTGLYVAELDRPWTDLPLMFQGFEIRTDDELAILRQYCNDVYVEEARSRAEAYAELEKANGDDAEPDDTGAPDIGASLGTGRYPDSSRFAERVSAAAANRSDATGFFQRALDDIRLGRSVNSREARVVVGDIATQVSGNASATMWLTNLGSKDEQLSTHAVNVCVLALAFGMHLGLDRDRLECIGLGALLHDVGKVNLPAELLSRAGPLNPEEWDAVRRHPTDGYEAARSAGDIGDEVLDIIRMHHERVDGTGYPAGLAGEAVPLHARIVGIANAYDSLTSDRPYRGARPADEVLQQFYNEAGGSFGAKLVQEFIRCVGIFPVGSLVELDNGALGVVVGSSPETRLRPAVLLVRTPRGEYYDKRLLLNLAAEAGADDRAPARRIRRVVNPSQYDIDIPAIVAFEFGVVL